VESINGNILVVDGQIVNVDSAEIKGTPQLGATARVEGYYNSNGLFIVTNIEFESNSSSEDGSSSSSDDADHGDEASGGDHSGSGGRADV
jgi:hypothetical protein